MGTSPSDTDTRYGDILCLVCLVLVFPPDVVPVRLDSTPRDYRALYRNCAIHRNAPVTIPRDLITNCKRRKRIRKSSKERSSDFSVLAKQKKCIYYYFMPFFLLTKQITLIFGTKSIDKKLPRDQPVSSDPPPHGIPNVFTGHISIPKPNSVQSKALIRRTVRIQTRGQHDRELPTEFIRLYDRRGAHDIL